MKKKTRLLLLALALAFGLKTGGVFAQVSPGIPGSPDLATAAWQIQHTPAVSNQATITQAAPGAGKRNVTLSATFCVVPGATAGQAQARVRDASTTYFAATMGSLAAAAGPSQCTTVYGPWLSPANTATICDFSTLITSAFESVACNGYVTVAN